MAKQITPIAEQKDELHPRNKHRNRYNFPKLIAACPKLSEFVFKNQYDDLSVDFKDPLAVKTLNQALLKHFYGIKHWDIRPGYLCPPIPGRADYIHNAADLLADANGSKVPQGKSVKVLDIGVGANCIYPLIGLHEYRWNFVGSDIDDAAIRSARQIVEANEISQNISIRKQESNKHFYTNIIKPGETFDLTICNPPFHSSLKQAAAKTQRKWKNLGQNPDGLNDLNFGGNELELSYPGGEQRFVQTMIEESTAYAKSCLWFTSLISKKESLKACYYTLDQVKAIEVRTVNMSQGQKNSRMLAWTFMDENARKEWAKKRWGKE